MGVVEIAKDYLWLIKDSINLQIIIRSAIAAAICLILGIVILLICRKYKLFVRKNKIYNIITYVYVLYIPLVMLVFGGLFFTAKAVEKTIYTKLDAMTPVIDSFSSDYARDMKDYLIKNELMKGNFSLSSMKDALILFIKTYPYVQAANDSYVVSLIAMMPESVQNTLYSMVADRIIDKVSTTLSDVTRLDPSTLSRLWSMDLEEVVSGGLITEIIKSQLDAHVKPVKSTVLKIWILLMLIPFIETLIAKLVEKRLSQEPSVH